MDYNLRFSDFTFQAAAEERRIERRPTLKLCVCVYEADACPLHGGLCHCYIVVALRSDVNHWPDGRVASSSPGCVFGQDNEAYIAPNGPGSQRLTWQQQEPIGV